MTGQLILACRLTCFGYAVRQMVYNPDGIAPTILAGGGGNTEPKILVKEDTRG